MKKLLLYLSVFITVISVTGCCKGSGDIYINEHTEVNQNVTVDVSLDLVVEDTVLETDSITHDTVIVKERVTLRQFDTITKSWAKIDGLVEGSSLHSEFAYGVCWGTTSNPTVEDNYSTPIQFEKPDWFKITVSDLKTHTNYYIRPYILKANQYYYGDTSKEFTTN